MRTSTQTMTAEELIRLNIDQPCELIDGELHMMAPAGGEHGSVAGNVHGLLWTYVRRKRLGRVFAAETGYLLKRDKDTVLAPDVSFVSKKRLGSRWYSGYLPFAPDLAVEVVSPSQTLGEARAKSRLWLKYGTAMVWVVLPESNSVIVLRPGRPELRLGEGDLIEGGRVVPGFVCDVREFFE